MTYGTRLQIGDYFLTIDIAGNMRQGYWQSVFFQWAHDVDKPTSAAMRHTLPDRFSTDAKAHRAAFDHAAIIKTGHIELP